MRAAKHLKVIPALYHGSCAVLYIFCRLSFNYKAFGQFNVPNDGRGVILAPNHASYLDPPLIGIALKQYVTFLAKDYLYKPPVFGTWLKWIGTMPIKAGAGDLGTIRDMLRLLQDGRTIVVYPEGTRTPDGELQQPESGVGFLAKKSKAWVVPVYIKGSFEAFPRDRKMFKRHPISVTFGKAFIPGEDPALTGSNDPHMAISRRIMEEIKKLKDPLTEQGRQSA